MPVLTGIDALAQNHFKPLQGRRVGLITNPTGRLQTGQATADALFHAPGVHLACLFGPEHGIRAVLDQAQVDDSRDDATGLPVWSLYGARTAPNADQMRGLDTLVFDIADVGCRFYTYISTLLKVMEAAADAHLDVVVCDRPNPITGTRTEGPLPDPHKLSFTAPHPVPVRHGLSVGEMARLMHAERGLACGLTVAPCAGWGRADWFDGTGLLWTNPSPNMRSLTQAALYPGVGLLEMTNVSVGRGTDTPFELVGASWLDARAFAAAVNAQAVPGARAVPVEFTPRASAYAGEPCGGVGLIVTDRNALDAVRLGLTMAGVLRAGWAASWQPDKLQTLLANKTAFNGVMAGRSYAELARAWADDLAAWEQRTRPYLLYP